MLKGRVANMMNHKINPKKLEEAEDLYECEDWDALSEEQKMLLIYSSSCDEWDEFTSSQKFIWLDCNGSFDEVVWDRTEMMANVCDLPDGLSFLGDAYEAFSDVDDDIACELRYWMLYIKLHLCPSEGYKLTPEGAEACLSIADDVIGYARGFNTLLHDILDYELTDEDENRDWVNCIQEWMDSNSDLDEFLDSEKNSPES